MGNNSFAPILGVGSVIISLNGKKVLIRDCLHVPELRQPLFTALVLINVSKVVDSWE
jgi:hypothetical protein